MIKRDRAKKLPLILSSFLLSVVLILFLPFFFVATIVHLSFYHRYDYKDALLSLSITTATTLTVALLIGVWVIVLPFLLLNLLFTLLLLIPVKRRLHTALIIGLFSGVALIASMTFFLNNEEISDLMLTNWNSLAPEALQFANADTLRTEILYQFSQEGVALMVKVVAFVWFMSKWLGDKQRRINWLGQFHLSKGVYALLLVSVIGYLAIKLLLQWTPLDMSGRILFLWSNLAPVLLFLLFLEGLGVVLRWGEKHQWTPKQREQLSLLLLFTAVFPLPALSVGVQVLLGIIGLGFSKRQKFMSI